MAKKKSTKGKAKARKTSKPAAKKGKAKANSSSRKKSAGGKKRASAKKSQGPKASGSGIVYTSLLRAAFAGRIR